MLTLRMRFPLLVVLLFWVFQMASGQDMDTLSYARAKAYASELDTAELLLDEYTRHHRNLDAYLLHAQVRYWKKDFSGASAVYQTAFDTFPEAFSIHLEYGRMLWELGRMNPSKKQLNAYLAHDSLHPEANIMLAYLEMWTGHTQAAKDLANKLLIINPENSRAKEILSEIRTLSAPAIQLGTTLSSDDQPTSAYQFDLAANWYRSWLLAPSIHLSHKTVETEGQNYPFISTTLANEFYFAPTKTKLQAHAGLLASLAATDQRSGLWGLLLTQALPAHFSIQAGLEKRPYLYTIRSIQQALTMQFSQIAINYNHSGKWLGKAARETQLFSDQNKVQTTYVWILAPLLDRWGLRLQAGYGYTFAHSDESRFQPMQPYDPNIPEDQEIEGIYDPYFTPQNQEIHAVLGAIQYSRLKKINFSLRGSSGIKATADIPYFYPDLDSEGQAYYKREFLNGTYTPWEVHAEIKWELTAKSALSGFYSYQHLLFYSTHSLGLQFQHYFLP